MAKTLKKLGNHIETNKNFQMYIISLLALFQVVENIRNPFVLFSDWQSTELTVNYTYGFVRRGFMGSITYAVSQIFSLDYAKAICIVQFITETAYEFDTHPHPLSTFAARLTENLDEVEKLQTV